MKLSCLLVLALLSVTSAYADTELYFVSPQDGDKVSGEFKVSFAEY